MKLKDIRKKIIEINGMRDLVVDDDYEVDNGCNFYINAGIRMLDDLFNTRMSFKSFSVKVNAGDNYVKIKNLRSIYSIFAYCDSIRTPLCFMGFQGFLSYYNFLASTNLGRPTYYTIVNSQFSGEGIDTFFSTTALENFSEDVILFSPAADKDYIIEICGDYYSAELTDDIKTITPANIEGVIIGVSKLITLEPKIWATGYRPTSIRLTFSTNAMEILVMLEPDEGIWWIPETLLRDDYVISEKILSPISYAGTKIDSTTGNADIYRLQLFTDIDKSLSLNKVEFLVGSVWTERSLTDWTIINGAYNASVSTTTLGVTENIFTSRYPHMVVYAALYQIEVTHRNTEGSKDWMNAITMEMINISKNLIWQESQILIRRG